MLFFKSVFFYEMSRFLGNVPRYVCIGFTSAAVDFFVASLVVLFVAFFTIIMILLQVKVNQP
jgi:hypothetical protein